MKLPAPTTQTAAALFELLSNTSVTSIEMKQRQSIGFPNSRVSNLINDYGLSIVSSPEKYEGTKWKRCGKIARYMLVTDREKAEAVYTKINQ